MPNNTWSSSGSTSWNTGANWSLGTVPGVADDVIFDATSTVDCVIDADVNVNSILNNGGAYTGHFDNATNNKNITTSSFVFAGTGSTLSMGTGTTWTLAGNFILYTASEGKCIVDSGTSTVVMTANGVITSDSGHPGGNYLKNITINNGVTVGTAFLSLDGTFLINGTFSTGGYVYHFSNADIQVTGTGSFHCQILQLYGDVSQMDGSFSTGDRVIVRGGTIVAADYSGVNLESIQSWVPGSGTYRFNNIFRNSRNINCSVNNPNFEILGGLDLYTGWTKGTGTITFISSGSGIIGIDAGIGNTLEDTIINSSGGATYQMNADAGFNSLDVQNGTFRPNGKTINILNDFDVQTTGGMDKTNINGSAITVGGDLNLLGTVGTPIDIQGTATWTLTVSGTPTVNYVNVAYCDSSAGGIIPASNSTDSGNNINWNFAPRFWLGTSASWNTAANWATTSGGAGGAGVPTAASAVIFDGNGTGNCTIDIAPTIVALIMKSGYTGTLENSTNDLAVAIATDVALSGNQLDMGDNTWAVSGSWNSSGLTTLNENLSTLLMNGTNKIFTPKSGETFYNVTISNDIDAVNSFIVSNNLTINNSLDMPTYSVTCNGTLSLAASATLTTTTGTVTVAGTFSLGNSASVTTTTGNYVISGATLTIGDGGSINSTSGNMTVNGNAINVGTGSTLDIGSGDITMSGGSIFTANSGTVTANSIEIQGTVSNPLPSATYNADIQFTLGNAESVTFGAVNLEMGYLKFVISGGVGQSIVNSNNPTFTINGDFENQIGTWTAGTGTINIDGGISQTITDSGGVIFEDIIVDNNSTFNMASNISCQSFTCKSGSWLDLNTFDFTTNPGDFDMESGSRCVVAGLPGSTITVGNDCDIDGVGGATDYNASARWDLDVGNTAFFRNATVAYCDATGGVYVDASDNCIDGGNNIHISFDNARYWISAGLSNWNNINNWSLFSGGAVAPSLPNATTPVKFDGNGLGDCVIDVDVNVLSIRGDDAYTGHLDNATNNRSITVNNFEFFNGTLSMGTSTIWTISGNFALRRTHLVGYYCVTDPGTSTVVMTANGGIATGSVYNLVNPLYNLTINSGVTITAYGAKGTGIKGTMIVDGYFNHAADFMMRSGADVKVSNTGAITVTYPRMYTGATISQMDGSFVSTAFFVYGGGTLTPAHYQVNMDSSATYLVLSSGTYRFNTIYRGSRVNNSVNNPNIELTGGLDINYWIKGTGTLTFLGTGSGIYGIDANNQTLEDTVINNSNGTYLLTQPVKFNSLTVSAGTIDFNSQNIETLNNFTMAAGTQVVNPGNLNGTTQTVGGNLSLTGQVGTPIDLVASATWNLNVSGTQSISYVDVAYCDASGGNDIDATDGTNTDSGNNINWFFTDPNERYWVASGAQSWNDVNQWAFKSGGFGGRGIPTSVQDTFFDANGVGNCNVNTNPFIKSLDVDSGYTGTLDSSASNPDWSIKEKLIIDSGVTYQKGTGTINLTGSGSGTHDIDTNNILMEDIVINDSGAVKRLVSKLKTDSFNLTNGNLNFNSQDLETITTFTIGTGGQITSPSSMNGITVTVGSDISLTGESGDLIIMNATAAWYLNVAGNQSVSYTSVAYCDASGGNDIDATDGTNNNAGNNINWFFADPNERYWIASAIQNFNDGNQWAFGSGLSGGRGVPTTAGFAIFDGNGVGDCTVNSNPNIKGLEVKAAYSGTIDDSGNPDWILKEKFIFDASTNWTKGTGTITLSGAGSGTHDIDTNNVSIEDIVINDSGATKQLLSDLNTESFSFQNGSFDMNDNDMYINSGNLTIGASASWVHSVGSSNIRFTGTGAQSISDGKLDVIDNVIVNKNSGTFSFATNLNPYAFFGNKGNVDMNSKTVTTISDFDIDFPADFVPVNNLGGSTINIGGNMSWTGDASDQQNLNPDTVWYLNVTGVSAVSYADVKNSDASGGQPIFVNKDNTVNQGNNDNWLFGGEKRAGGRLSPLIIYKLLKIRETLKL